MECCALRDPVSIAEFAADDPPFNLFAIRFDFILDTTN